MMNRAFLAFLCALSLLSCGIMPGKPSPVDEEKTSQDADGKDLPIIEPSAGAHGFSSNVSGSLLSVKRHDLFRFSLSMRMEAAGNCIFILDGRELIQIDGLAMKALSAVKARDFALCASAIAWLDGSDIAMAMVSTGTEALPLVESGRIALAEIPEGATRVPEYRWLVSGAKGFIAVSSDGFVCDISVDLKTSGKPRKIRESFLERPLVVDFPESPGSSCLAVDSVSMFSAFDDGSFGLRSRIDGSVQWKNPPEGTVSQRILMIGANASSVFVVREKSLSRHERNTGKTIAMRPLNSGLRVAMAIGLSRVYLSCNEGIMSLDAENLETIECDDAVSSSQSALIMADRLFVLGVDGVLECRGGVFEANPDYARPGRETRLAIEQSLEKYRGPEAKDRMSIAFREYIPGAVSVPDTEFSVFNFVPRRSVRHTVSVRGISGSFKDLLLVVFSANGNELLSNSGEIIEGHLQLSLTADIPVHVTVQSPGTGNPGAPETLVLDIRESP